MIKKIKLLVFIFLSTTSSIACAQTDSIVLNHHIKALQQYATSHPIEKVHLHLDRQLYSIGDTIWFKAYTVIGSYHQLSAFSGVLYAELISSGDTVVQRLTLQLNAGIAAGEFVLPYTYKLGSYRLRAYTNWMRNDSNYFYDRKIIVSGLNSMPDTHVGKPNLLTNNNIKQNQADNPDVRFFPEGGYLVNGLRSKVAFTATNKDALAAYVQGVIIDNDNNEVASFSAQHDGMGQFPLTAQPGKQYRAKIICTDGSGFIIDLPKAKDTGITLTINNARDSIYLKVAANDVFYKNNYNSAFYVIAQAAGKCYYTSTGKLTNPVFTTDIAKTRFPTGIVRFTLFSQNGEPLSERIVFIQNPDLLNLEVTTEKESYAPKEKVKIDLAAKNEEAKGVVGTFSVTVNDETKTPVDETSETTILTDLLYTSDMNGNIENPNYYFIDQSDKTRSDLDVLMLTKGYCKFNWNKILSGTVENIIYKPEEGLSLEGIVKTNDDAPLAGVKVSITCLTENLAMDTVTDKNGHFIFNKLNITDSARLFIKAQKKRVNHDFNIYIRQPVYPGANNSSYVYISKGTVQQVAANTQQTTNQQSKPGVISNRAITLKEVKIKSTKTAKPGISNKYGADDPYTIPGNRIQDFGFVKIALAHVLPGVIYSNGAFHKLEGFPLPTLHIVLDNREINADDIEKFVRVDDVQDVKILEGYTYKALYGVNRNPTDHDQDDIVLITTKQYAGINQTRDYKLKNVTLKVSDGSGALIDQPFITTPTPSNTMVYLFAGYYNAHEFNSFINLKQGDKRKTIYWNPNIITDKDGKASFEYFNADSPGVYRVVIEGIDADGNLGRQVFRYKVE